MEMTDLKAAIDDYSDAAENGILDLKERLDMMETKMHRPGSNGSSEASSDDIEHKNAFLNGFIRKGDDTALRAIESKTLSADISGGISGADGGYAVPKVIDTEIERQLRNLSPLRGIVKVQTIETSDYRRLLSVGEGNIDSGWVGEEGARTDKVGTPKLEEIIITPGEIYSNAAATQRALDDLQFDAEMWLMEEVAEEFAIREGNAIVSGDGVDKPTGFLHSTSITSIAAQGGVLSTGVAAAFPAVDPADLLIDLVHSLKARYRKGASFVLNSKTLAAVRKFKDADGNFIWRAGLMEGQPDMLLGYPVVEAEDMPDFDADAAGVATAGDGEEFAVAFGNFERAYTLVDRAGIRVLRDPYTNKPFVSFYATKRVGGALVNPDALKLLQFKA